MKYITKQNSRKSDHYSDALTRLRVQSWGGTRIYCKYRMRSELSVTIMRNLCVESFVKKNISDVMSQEQIRRKRIYSNYSICDGKYPAQSVAPVTCYQLEIGKVRLSIHIKCNATPCNDSLIWLLNFSSQLLRKINDFPFKLNFFARYLETKYWTKIFKNEIYWRRKNLRSFQFFSIEGISVQYLVAALYMDD
jgi:hypothetical protein